MVSSGAIGCGDDHKVSRFQVNNVALTRRVKIFDGTQIQAIATTLLVTNPYYRWCGMYLGSQQKTPSFLPDLVYPLD
jgi:hypothetical protein